MTDNTQPLALMLADRLHHEQPTVLRIDAEHAGEELRRQHARIAELEAELEAAPKAAPAVGDELRDTLVAVSAAIAEQDDRAAQKMIREILAASPAPPAEQQAAPKAAPVKACVCGEPQAPGTVHRVDGPCYVAAPQQEAQEPVAYIHVPHYTVEGQVRPVVSFEKYQQDYADGIYSTRIPLYTAPQPAPAPLSDDTERLEWLLWKLPGDALRYVVGELADTSSGAEFRAAIDTAIAAQGGKA